MRSRRVPPNPRALLSGGVLVARVETSAEDETEAGGADSAAVDAAAADPPSRTRRAARRAVGVARVGGRVLAGALVLLSVFLIVNLSSASDTANADVLGVCVDSPGDNSWDPDQVRSGMDGLIPQALPNGNWTADGASGPISRLPDPKLAALTNGGESPLWSNPPQAADDATYTDYEKLGMAGTFWSVDYASVREEQSPCFPLEKMIGSFLANRIFEFAKVVDRVAISTYQWATSGAIADSLNAPLDEAVGLFYQGGEGQFGLVQSLVVVAIVAGVVWVAWMAIAKRRFSLGLGGIAWMVAAFVALMLFIGKPSALASTSDQVVGDTTNSVMSASSQIIGENDDGRLADIYGDVRDTENGAGRVSADMMWRVLVFQPWATGQWGSATDAVPLYYPGSAPGAEQFYAASADDATQRGLDARVVQLYAQACLLTLSDPAVFADAETPPDRLPVVAPCEGTIIPTSETGQDLTESPETYQAPNMVPIWVNSQWWWALENWTCTEAGQCLSEYGDSPSPGTEYRAIWSGDKAGHRIMAALTALLAAVLLGGLLFLISAAIIAYGLMMYMLLLIGPFVLLVGIHPSFGRRLAIGWANVLLQNVFKRLFLGILLAIIILIYAVIGRADVGWFQQMALMVGATVGVLLLRAPLMAAIGVVRVGEGSAALEGADDRAAGGVHRAGRGLLMGAGAVGSRSVRGAGMAGRGLVGAGVGYRRASEYAAREGVPDESRRRVILSGTLGGISGAARGKIRGGASSGATRAASDRWQQIDDQNLAATARSHGERWQSGQEAIRQRRADRVIRAYRRNDGQSGAGAGSGTQPTSTASRLSATGRGLSGGDRAAYRSRAQGTFPPPRSEEPNRRTNPPRPGPQPRDQKYYRRPSAPSGGGGNGSGNGAGGNGGTPPPMPAQPRPAPPRPAQPRPSAAPRRPRPNPGGDQPAPPPPPGNRRQR